MTEATARTIDDAAARDRTVDESGTVLGERYRLLRPLGEGAAGIVYAAIDERIGADVAIKVVRGSSRRDEITLARFHREARAAGKLGHPNIVRVTDFGTHASGSPYVVMERLDGETLEARIARVGRLDPAMAVDVHVQLADALAAAHAAGVLHRDVKPANVFLTQLATGKVLVKLLDFGLAELYQEPASPRITEQGLLVGSLAYLAPERILGGPADERSDVYAVGVSLHESLTGELPFSAPNSMMLRAKILEGAPSMPGQARTELDRELASVVRACLERDPAARLATAAEVRRRLLVAGDALLRAPARPPVAPAPTRVPMVAVGLAALACFVLAAWWMSRAPDAAPPRAIAVMPPEDATVVGAPPVEMHPPVTQPEVRGPPSEPVLPVSETQPDVATPLTVEPEPSSPSSRQASRARPAARLVETTREPEPPPAPVPTPAAPVHADEPPSRFDQVREPDWGEPLPR